MGRQKRQENLDYQLKARCNKDVKAFSIAQLKRYGYPDYGEAYRALDKGWGLIHPDDRPAIDLLAELRNRLVKVGSFFVPAADEEGKEALKDANKDLGKRIESILINTEDIRQSILSGRKPKYLPDRVACQLALKYLIQGRLFNSDGKTISFVPQHEPKSPENITGEELLDAYCMITTAAEVAGELPDAAAEWKGISCLLPYQAMWTIRVDYTGRGGRSKTIRDRLEFIYELNRSTGDKFYATLDDNLKAADTLTSIISEAEDNFDKDNPAPNDYISEFISRIEAVRFEEMYVYNDVQHQPDLEDELSLDDSFSR